MAGHSKWNNIKRVKAVVDAKKGAIFSRISKDISIAVQIGASGDIKTNPYLRIPLEKAKSANMTSDKIEKAINKGLGLNNKDEIESKIYEVSMNGGVILLIDCETDNSNRTREEIRSIVYKDGSKMVPEGSLSWSFKEIGRIGLEVKDNINKTFDQILGISNIQDFSIEENQIFIFTNRDELKLVLDQIKDLNIKLEVFEVMIIKQPLERVLLDDEQSEKSQDLMEKIRNHPDVVYVWDNIKNP